MVGICEYIEELSGVPQGTVLAAILFIINMLDTDEMI